MFFPTAPISFSIELTYSCPNRCRGCANGWNTDRQQYLKEWKALLDAIAPPQHRQKYAELIRISGGEPTLHQDFQQIIEYLESFDVAYAVFTSGRWHKDILPVCRGKKNLMGLLVSLYGADAASHNSFVQAEGAFEETCVSIQRAVAAGLEVFSNTVLTQKNCEQVEELIALSQTLGASYAVFNRFLGPPNPLEPQEDTLRAALAFIEQQQRQGVHCRLGNTVPPCFMENSSDGANSGIEHCVIAPGGWVRPDSTMPYMLGNVLTQDIEAIWQSEQAQHYRASLPAECLHCAALSDCRGGYRLPTTEQNFAPDPLMRKALPQLPARPLELDPLWKPRPLFSLRKGLVTRYSYSVPIDERAYPLLQALNGTTSLYDLQQRFGEDCLDFIGYLYHKRFIC